MNNPDEEINLYDSKLKCFDTESDLAFILDAADDGGLDGYEISELIL